MFSDCDLKEIGSMLIAEKAAPQTLSARETLFIKILLHIPAITRALTKAIVQALILLN